MASVTDIPRKAATAEPCGLRAVLLQLRFKSLVLPIGMTCPCTLLLVPANWLLDVRRYCCGGACGGICVFGNCRFFDFTDPLRSLSLGFGRALLCKVLWLWWRWRRCGWCLRFAIHLHVR